MKIYDCFMYWDEDLILDLRFNILDKYVDKFVIVESDKTWQNNQKSSPAVGKIVKINRLRHAK